MDWCHGNNLNAISTLGTPYIYTILLINPRHACTTRVAVLVCLCLSVKSHLTSGVSVLPENTVMYSAGNGSQKICGVFSETTLLQRSSTAPLKAIHTVSHFLSKVCMRIISIAFKGFQGFAHTCGAEGSAF